MPPKLDLGLEEPRNPREIDIGQPIHGESGEAAIVGIIASLPESEID